MPIAAFLLIASVIGGCSAGAAPTPQVVYVTPVPTNADVASVLVIASPVDGATVDAGSVAVSGTGPPNVEVIHDISYSPDSRTTTDSSGSWTISAQLSEGSNQLKFRLGGDDSTAQTVTVTYLAPVAEVTPEPVAAVTPAPTAAPTVAPVSYKKLSDRNWKKLVKAPDNFIGRTYQIWACIWQFDAATGEDAFLGNASYKKQEYWNLYGENASFTGDADRLADFVEGDAVVMNVVSAGSYSYDTQAGGNTTVPAFEIVKITRKGSCE